MEIFAVGIGDGGVKTELNKIASQPVASHVFTATYGELDTLSLLLAKKICEGELLKVELVHFTVA